MKDIVKDIAKGKIEDIKKILDSRKEKWDEKLKIQHCVLEYIEYSEDLETVSGKIIELIERYKNENSILICIQEIIKKFEHVQNRIIKHYKLKECKLSRELNDVRRVSGHLDDLGGKK